MTQPHQNHDDETAGTRPEAGPDEAAEPVGPETGTPAGEHDGDPVRGTAGLGAADVPPLSDWQPAGNEEAVQETAPRPVGDGQVIPAPTAHPAHPVAPAPAQEAQNPRPEPVVPESAAQLTADRLLEPHDREPASGWRRLLFRATFGRVNVGDSDTERIRRQTERRIAAPLDGSTRYVPVLSRKGGVGKTTVTTLLGMSLAQLREDRIIALDANPDRGTLSDRSPGTSAFTARHLVQNRFMVDTFSKLSSYAAREGSRLHVLASDTDPRVAEAFDDADYRAVTDLLSKYYSIVLTDSGTGMVHSVMKGTLEKADAVVLVSGASVDEARLASETLSWLEAHGRSDLASRAIVVINQSSGQGRGVNVEEIEAHFQSRVATVVRLPHDPHLAEGSRVELDRLKPATRDAVRELAALVVDELKG
ncbi:MinD/ParA family protein [Arthrobacter rhombi]|uniref:MinD/ParA family ATP-binding protein n=1 Tax=Arthrobacter rhombi TaxID=71253 RepID=UPI0031E38BB8